MESVSHFPQPEEQSWIVCFFRQLNFRKVEHKTRFFTKVLEGDLFISRILLAISQHEISKSVVGKHVLTCVGCLGSLGMIPRILWLKESGLVSILSILFKRGNLSWLEIAPFSNRKYIFKRSMFRCYVWYLCIIHDTCIIYTQMLFLFGCSNGDIGPSETTVWILFLVVIVLAPLQPYQFVFDRFFSASIGKASVHHQLTCF